MPTVEEILRDLEADDESTGDGADETPDAPDTATIKAVRDWGKGWEKKAKAQEKELEKLRTFQTEVTERERTATVAGVFKELGLPERQAELFLKTNEGEVTADVVRQFVTDFGLVPSGEGKGEEPEEKKGFEPGGISPQGTSPKPTLVTPQELLKILKEDPARADQLVAEGKVQTASYDDLTWKSQKGFDDAIEALKKARE